MNCTGATAEMILTVNVSPVSVVNSALLMLECEVRINAAWKDMDVHTPRGRRLKGNDVSFILPTLLSKRYPPHVSTNPEARFVSVGVNSYTGDGTNSFGTA